MTTKITTDNILDGTIDAVDMKDLAITNAKLAGSIDVTSKITGSVPASNLPTIPVSKGGTGLTSLGSAGQAVKVNSGASALEFGTAGGILQVIQNFDDQYATYSNTSPDAQAVVLSQAITPSATSSKILIQVNLCVSCGNSGNKHYGLVLYRGSTEIGSGDKSSWNTGVNETHSAVDMDNYTQPDRILTGMFLDSPNTTSATTYNIKSYIYDYGSSVTAKNLIVNGGGYAYNNQETAVTSSSLTLMEVSG